MLVAFRILLIFVALHSSRYHLHGFALHLSQIFPIVWIVTKNCLQANYLIVHHLPFTSVEIRLRRDLKSLLIALNIYAAQLPPGMTGRGDHGRRGAMGGGRMWKVASERRSLGRIGRLSCNAAPIHNLCRSVSRNAIQGSNMRSSEEFFLVFWRKPFPHDHMVIIAVVCGILQNHLLSFV